MKNLYRYIQMNTARGTVIYADRNGTALDLLADIRALISDKETQTVNVNGLDYISRTIFTELYKQDFNVLNIKTKKSDMLVGDVRFLMNEGATFFIQIKTGKRAFLTFQNVENITGQSGYLTDADDPEEYFIIFDNIKKLYNDSHKKKDTDHIMYSIGHISRTLYNKTHSTYRGKPSDDIDGIPVGRFLEQFARPGYHGGFNYMTEKAKTYTGRGIVLDINSLYPYVACTYYLPTTHIYDYGAGAVPEDYTTLPYVYTIEKAYVEADLKDNGLPCILPDDKSILDSRYLTHIHHKLTLTEYDKRMLYVNYNVKTYTAQSYVSLIASNVAFRDYLEPLYEEKRTAIDSAMRKTYKALQNNLIGTFGKKVYRKQYRPHVDADGTIYFYREDIDPETYNRNLNNATGLVVVAQAVTSIARFIITTDIRKIDRDMYLYSDTDSIHLATDEAPAVFHISDELGDYKIEHRFDYVQYKAIKEYAYIEAGTFHMTAAGIAKGVTRNLSDLPQYIRATNPQQAQALANFVKTGDLRRIFEEPCPNIYIHTDPLTGAMTVQTEWNRIIGRMPTLDEWNKIDEQVQTAILARLHKQAVPAYLKIKGTDPLNDKYYYNGKTLSLKPLTNTATM